MRPRISVLVTVVVLVVGGAVLTACDPVVDIVVTTTADGSDADPGDGVCEATVGVGDCTLRAAIDEGSSVWAADLTVPAGTYPLTVVDGDGSIDLDVTGSVSINWESSAPVVVTTPVGEVGIDVAAGAKLTASGLSLTDGRVVVAGNALLDRATLFPSSSAVLTETGSRLAVLPGGVAALGNSFVGGPYGSIAVENAGSLSLVYTRVTSLSQPGMVTTTGAGVTTMQASRFLPMGAFHGVFAQPQIPVCAGNLPQSNGGNWTPNTSCQLNGANDVQTATITGSGTGMQYAPTWRDQIPVGVAGCGTSSTVDAAGNPRPTDDDGDGVAKCDSGDREGLTS